jgi:hypothetical protein
MWAAQTDIFKQSTNRRQIINKLADRRDRKNEDSCASRYRPNTSAKRSMQIACQSKDRFLVCKDLHGNRSWNTQMCVAISYDISFIFLVYYYLTPLSYLFSLVSPWFFGEYLFFLSYMEYAVLVPYSFRNVYIFISGGVVESGRFVFCYSSDAV